MVWIRDVYCGYGSYRYGMQVLALLSGKDAGSWVVSWDLDLAILDILRSFSLHPRLMGRSKYL